MHVTSLGFRTDLMLRRLAGSTITDHGSYQVIRTRSNPGFWRGNFILYGGPARPGDAVRWRAAFDQQFPDAAHLALGVDGTTGDAGDAAELARLGVTVEVTTVLTAAQPRPPLRPNADAIYRSLTGDDDWAQAVELRRRCDNGPDTATHRAFVERQHASYRSLCERGHGMWFGAFTDGRIRSGLGVFTDGTGVARYSSVETHPDYRGAAWHRPSSIRPAGRV